MHITSLLPIIFASYCLAASSLDKDDPKESIGSDSVAEPGLYAACTAKPVDYDAIRTAMLSDNFMLRDVSLCIETFCQQGDVDGLVAVYSNATYTEKAFLKSIHFGFAGKCGKMPVVKYFIKRRDPNPTNMHVMASTAASYDHLDAVKYVMSHKKYPHESRPATERVLVEAAKVGSTDVVRWILDEYMTANEDELHSAAEMADRYEHWEVIDVLIEHGFDINDNTWLDMADIRNNYNAWRAQKEPVLGMLEAHLPKAISEKIFKTLPDVDAGDKLAVL